MICSVSEFFYHIAPDVIAAFVSLIGGFYLLSRYFGRRANEDSFVDALIKKLEEIAAEALIYWTEGVRCRSFRETQIGREAQGCPRRSLRGHPILFETLSRKGQRRLF